MSNCCINKFVSLQPVKILRFALWQGTLNQFHFITQPLLRRADWHLARTCLLRSLHFYAIQASNTNELFTWRPSFLIRRHWALFYFFQEWPWSSSQCRSPRRRCRARYLRPSHLPRWSWSYLPCRSGARRL